LTTPAAAEIMSYESKNIGIPFRSYKFVSCPYKVDDATNPRQRDYVYFSKTKLGGEIIDNYLKTGETFEGVELSLMGETGGTFVKKIAKGATKTSV